MPYTIRTKDGIQIDGIPDDISADDARLKAQVAELRAAGQTVATFAAQATMVPGQATPPVVAPQAGTPAQRSAPSTLGQFLGYLGKDIGVAARGAIQGLASPVTMLADPATELLNMILPDKYKQLPPSQGLTEVLNSLGVANPETEAQRILQATTAGLAGAGGQVAAGRALQGAGSAAVRGIGQTLASQPVQQLAGGAAAGAAAQGAAEAGGGPLVQMGAGLLGGMAGSALGGMKLGAAPTAPTEEAKRAGVRLMTSDVREPSTFAGKWLRAAGEKIPYAGTGGLRATQQAERVEAVRDLVRQFGADDLAAASDDVMKDLLGKRSADLMKWSAAKNEVIDALSIPAEGKIALPGGQTLIAATPGQVPSRVVPVTATTQKIDDSILFLKQLKSKQVEPVIAVLDDWKQAIQNQDLRNIEVLRKQIGEAFKAPELASVRSTGERVLSDIYGAVKDDMTAYIKSTGGEKALTKWQVANKELSKMMGELEIPALKSALERGEATPEVVNSLLFSRKRSDVEALYRNLSATGKASARTAVLARAAENAGGVSVSPDKFAAEVKRLGNQVGVMFSGDELKQVNGLVRVLDATKRAGQASVMPPTGIQAVLPAGAAALASFFGGGLEGFIGTMAAGAGIGGAARLYESKAVRDILAKFPTVKAGGPEEAALFKRLLEAAQAVKQTQGASGGAH